MTTKENRFLVWLLVIAAATGYFLSVLGANGTIQEAVPENKTGLKINYFHVSLDLINLDLVARRASFNLSGVLGFDFNASSELYYAIVSTRESDLGMIKMGRITSGVNSSVYQIYSNESSFNGFFYGGPETYPFDRYSFNVTLSFFEDFSLAKENVTFTPIVEWPLKAQFNEPSNIFADVSEAPNHLVVSIAFTLDRPDWRGYATLLPIYLIFALLGFSMFLKIEPDKLTYRIGVYTAVLTSALTYSIAVQSVLPVGRYYLSIPEVLVYSIIGSATTFIVLTLLASRFQINRVLADTTAVIVSQSFLSLMLVTFYFAKYVEISFDYVPLRMITMQWIILTIFFGIVYFAAMSDLGALVKKPIGANQLNERLNKAIRTLYFISFVFSVCTSGIVAYERLVQSGIQSGWILEFFIRMSGNNVLLMIVLPLIAIVLYLALAYFLSDLFRLVFHKDWIWIRDFFGFFVVFSSALNFLYGFLLLPSDQLLTLISPIFLAALYTFFFWTIRPLRPEEAYARFVEWCGSI